MTKYLQMAPAVGRSFIVAVLLSTYCCGFAFEQANYRADVNQQCDTRRDVLMAEDPMGNGATFLRCKPTNVGHIGFWERKLCPSGLAFDFMNQQCSGIAMHNVGNEVNNAGTTTNQPNFALIESSCASGEQCIGGTVCDLRTMKCLCPVGTVPHMESLSCIINNGTPSTSISPPGSEIRMQSARPHGAHGAHGAYGATVNPYMPQAIPITPTSTYGIPYSIGPTPAPTNTNMNQQQTFFNFSPQPFQPAAPSPRPAYMNPNQPAPMPTLKPYIYPQPQTTYFSMSTPSPSMNNFGTVAPGSSCRNGQKCTGGSICNHLVGVCMCPSDTEDQGGICVLMQLEKVRIGERCDRFSECTDDATCFQGICQCLAPLTLHSGRCVPQQAVGARVGPGEPCDMGQTCIKGSVCHPEVPVCLCPNGTDLQDDSCVSTEEIAQAGVQTVFVTSGGHQLGGTNQAGVGAKCALNTECMIGAYCNGNTNPPSCQCLSTHVNIDGKCHKVIYPGQKGCEYDKQCTASFEGTSCVDRQCVCPEGSKAIEQTCVAEFALPGYTCNETTGLPMCSGGSSCLRGKCRCPSGLYEFQHQCVFEQGFRVKPGSPCGPLEHCPPNMVCSNSICVCPSGTEATETGCKKTARNLAEEIILSNFADDISNTPPGFFCLPDQEFCAAGHGLCMNGFCHCAPGYLRINDSCQPQLVKRGDNCFADLGQTCEPGSECIDGLCLCRGDNCRHLQEVVVSIAGQSCSDGQMCTGASTCVEGICQCAPGFHLKSGRCELLHGVFAPIGSRCTRMDRCSGGAVCLQDTCACIDGSVHRYGRCEQAPGGRCNQGQICTGDALCELGTCRCQEGKTLINQTCQRNVAAPGQSCQSGQLCSGGSVCRFSMCVCPAGHNIITEQCVQEAAPEEEKSGPFEAAPGQSCNDGETCTGQSVCYKGFCICPLDTDPVGDKCIFKKAVLPDLITTPAATAWWTAVPHRQSAEGPTEAEALTVPAGAKCDESLTCAPSTQCIRQLCRCNQGETLKNGQCHPVAVRGAPPGQYCQPDLGIECIGESYCANGTCVCPHNLEIAGGECAPVSFGYAYPGDSCQNGEVCLGRSSCSLSICRCLRNYHIVDKDCELIDSKGSTREEVTSNVKNRVMSLINGLPARPGEACHDLCTEDALCIAGVCKCPFGTLEHDFKCVSSNKAVNIISLSKLSGSGLPGDDCDSQDRCSGGAFCLDGKCACPEGYTPFSGRCALMLKKPGELCKASEQCDGGSICDYGMCKCRGSKIIRNGECAERIQVGLGEDCMHEQQCTLGSVCNIITGLCDCNEKEIPIGNTCQPEFVAAGSPCAAEQKCLGGSMCTNGVCMCPAGYQLMIGYCVAPRVTAPLATQSTQLYSNRALKPFPQDLHMKVFNQFQFPTKYHREQSQYIPLPNNSHQFRSPNFFPSSQQFQSSQPVILEQNQQPPQVITWQQPSFAATPTVYSSYQGVQPGYQCSPQDVCQGGSICFQGICTCPTGTTFSNGFCVSALNILKPGEYCGYGGTCGGNSVCSFSWCRCLNGTVNDNGQCTPINLQTGFWNSLFSSSPRQSPALSQQQNQVGIQARPTESCESGQICTGRSVCSWGFQGMTCQCPPYTAIYIDQCLPLQRQAVSATVGQSCANGESCAGGSVCQGGICTCPSGMEVYYGHCLQVAAPGQSCAQGEQCGGESVCETNLKVCLCQADSREVQGRCERVSSAQASRRKHSFAGLPCNMSIVCMDNSYCSATGFCVCEPGHEQVQRRCIPRDAMVELGNACNRTSICAGGSYCINGLCACMNGTSASHGECRSGMPQSYVLESCTNGEQCTGDAVCLDGTCQCPLGTVLKEGQCMKLSKPGQPCKSGEQCLEGSICDGIMCQCPSDMTEENGECLPTGLLSNPGATCFHGEICVGGSFCNESACLCPQDKNPVLDKCETPIANVHPGGACSFTFHCQMGLTCMFGICKCLPHEDDCPGGGRLTSPPGGSCSAQQECTGSSVCRDGWCVCPETNMIVTRGICVPATATRPAANLTAGGVPSFQAMPTSSGTPNPFAGRKATPGTSCGPLDVCIGGASCIDGMCICPHGTVVAGKRCVNADKMAKSSKESSVGKPRDACSHSGLICSGGTVCVGNSCQCPEGTILKRDRCSTGTAESADYARPYEPCQNGETCIGSSVCGKDQLCVCPAEKPILRDQECITSNEKPIIRGQEKKAAPGEACADVSTICTGDSMCVQGTCHCQTGYLAIQGQCVNLPTTTEGVTREGNYALPLMECGPSTQCLGGSMCDAISRTCKCPPGSIPLNGICQSASTFATQAPLNGRTTMGRYAGVQIQPPRSPQPECLDDTQCINDKVCIMKQCKCKPGFVEENGVCNPFEESKMTGGIELGQACAPGDTCASNGMCMDGTCWCPPGTSLGEHGYCQLSHHLPAPHPTFQPASTSSPQVKVPMTTINGQQPSESTVIDNSLPTTVRQSPAGYIATATNQQQAAAGVKPKIDQLQRSATAGNGTSTQQQVKPTFPAFVLPPKTEEKTAQRPVVLVRPNSNQLPLELGERCSPSDICVQNAICFEGACNCRHGFTAYEGRCLQEAAQAAPIVGTVRRAGEPCSPDDECSGGSFCDGNICKCPPQSQLVGDRCLQAPSQTCSNGELCSGGSICDNDSKTCICAAGHFNDNGICRSESAPKSVLPGQACNHGETCTGGSSCQQGVCKCAPDHFESDGYCRPVAGPSSSLNGTGLRFSSKSGEPRPKAMPCPLPEDPSACQLPDCFCSRNGRAIPGGLAPDQTPQFVVLTFDDAVNGKTFPDYQALFEDQRIKNPNGCPVKGTFFISHEWTNYDAVQWLFHQGHELASNSITHTPLNGKPASEWYGEMDGQRRILAKFANANENEIIGMRAPQLSIGGDEQLEMMSRAGFVYDNSISANPGHNGQPYWPQTMDYRLSWDCQTSECPTGSFPGIWEIPLNQFYGYYLPQIQAYKRSSMIRAATTLNATVEELVALLRNNFDRAYNSNRAPYVLSLNADFLQLNGEGVGMLALEKFISDVSANKDVWFVTLKELMEWLRNPVPHTQLDRIDSLKCRQGKKLHPSGRVPCSKPNRCMYRTPNLSSPEHQFHTCNPCPQLFPWVRNPVGKLYL